MSDPRYNRNREESEAKAGPFTANELAHFEALCAALYRLGELSGVESDCVVTSHGCHNQCGNRVPAGMPNGWVRSKYDVCPQCCTARKLVRVMHKDPPGAIDVLLGEYVIDEKTDAMRFFSGVERMRAGIK